MSNISNTPNISNINSDALILIASLVSVLISQDLTIDELNVLGDFFALISTNILTKADQEERLGSKAEIENQILGMEQQIQNLRRRL